MEGLFVVSIHSFDLYRMVFLQKVYVTRRIDVFFNQVRILFSRSGTAIDRILSFVHTEVYNFTVFNSGRKFMILLLRFVQAIKMSMVSLNIIYIGQ